MPTGRSLVFQAIPKTPSVTTLDSRTHRDEGPESLEAEVFEDVEDQIDRWVSLAVFGVLAVVTGLLLMVGLPRPATFQAQGTEVIALGVLELLLGTFCALIVRPSAIDAVAVASAVTIGDGVLVVVGGNGFPMTVGIATVVIGLVCAAAGAAQAIRSWFSIYRDDDKDAKQDIPERERLRPARHRLGVGRTGGR